MAHPLGEARGGRGACTCAPGPVGESVRTREVLPMGERCRPMRTRGGPGFGTRDLLLAQDRAGLSWA